MKTPAYWGIAGFPIAHSLTPRLFKIVGEYVGLSGSQCVFIEADSIDEFLNNIEHLEGDIWISCTAPLKHSPQERLGVSGPEGVNAINQLKRSDGEWSGTSTDGAGFVAAVKHIGINPKGTILKMRGGGSAARSIASAWSSEGGLIHPIDGRRNLVDGPWNDAIVKEGNAAIAIDLDATAGGGKSEKLDAERQVSISYGENWKVDDFAIIMVAAQHLEAWKKLFSPNKIDQLPSLVELLELLGGRNHSS